MFSDKPVRCIIKNQCANKTYVDLWKDASRPGGKSISVRDALLSQKFGTLMALDQIKV